MSNPAMTDSPTRQVVIVTGAAGEIGREVVTELVKGGAALGLTDLDAGGLVEASGELDPEAAVVRPMDLRDATRLGAFVSEVIDTFGGLDACVLAAGITGPVGHAGGANDEEIAEVFDINVIAMFRMLRAVLPEMRARHAGRIVALASGAGLGAAPYLAPYAASKHAVVGLVRSVAVEEAASGISINAICPGLVESPMLSRIEAGIRAMGGADSQAPPFGRNATPVEIAEAVAYLALRAPVYLTGATISIDGGLRA